MDFVIIFTIIFILLLLALLTRLVKGFLKGFFLVSMTFTLLLAIFSYFVYTDVANFKQGWEESPKLFLLHEKGYLVSGFKADPSDAEATVSPLPINIIDEYREPFSKQDYDLILDNNYKIFIIDFLAFKDVESLELVNVELSLAQIKELLEADSPTKDFTKIATGQDLPLPVDSEQDEMFRSTLFAGLFAKAVQQDGPMFIITQVKNDNIIVYPETTLFKSLKLIPFSMIKSVFSQAVEIGKETTTAAVVAGVDFIKEHKGEISDILG